MNFLSSGDKLLYLRPKFGLNKMNVTCLLNWVYNPFQYLNIHIIIALNFQDFFLHVVDVYDSYLADQITLLEAQYSENYLQQQNIQKSKKKLEVFFVIFIKCIAKTFTILLSNIEFFHSCCILRNLNLFYATM